MRSHPRSDKGDRAEYQAVSTRKQAAQAGARTEPGPGDAALTCSSQDPAQEFSKAQREETVAKHMGQMFVPHKHMIADSKTSPIGPCSPKPREGTP